VARTCAKTKVGSKTEAIHFPRLAAVPAGGQESSSADTEDIDIDEDCFMSFRIKFKYLGTFFVHA
jgi:hypothetical protein